MNPMVKPTRVVLESGKTWTFAIALDWPGWCRRGKGGEEAAIAALDEYADRYRAIVGPSFTPGTPEVVGRVDGGGVTDFGAIGKPQDWDRVSLTSRERERRIALLFTCWAAFDAVAADAPAALAKGPRGGGRDRDKVVAHVAEAERSYSRHLGIKVLPRTPWPEQREAIAEALRHPHADARWPIRYCINRMAWHVTDHLWEIQDKS